MKKIEHIGIAVKDLDEANKTYRDLFDTEPYKTEEVETEGVITSFFRIGESKIELLAATNPESPVAKFLEKRGEGMHHIAFDVDDIEAEVVRLEEKGFTMISKEPKKGADNKIVAFLHPKSAHGVLVELCQETLTSDDQE